MRVVPTGRSVLRAKGASPTSSRKRSAAQVRRSVAALNAVPLFDGFSKRHLHRLVTEAEVVTFEPGRTIVEEGGAGEAMFVVLSGGARVTRGGRKVASMVPGDFFGELSALDGGPRTASIVSETPMELLRVFRHTLHRMIEEEPSLAMGLLEGLARRLRQVQPGAPVT
ncbi:MAG: cyclic nucleotide-binding domain-containing protein [Actinomycetota bacterium]